MLTQKDTSIMVLTQRGLCLVRVRADVRYSAEVDDLVEARIVEQPASVEVAENANIVAAVAQHRVPIVILSKLDGLQPTV